MYPSQFLCVCGEMMDFFGRDSLKLKNLDFSILEMLFIVFVWLNHYPHYSVLSCMFGTNISSISRIISSMLPKLCYFFLQFIPERKVSSNYSKLSQSISFIMDSTIHYIQKPISGQKKYYNGHYHFHGILTHLLLDYDERIISVATNVPGAIHDANFAKSNKVFAEIVGDDYALADPGFQGVPYAIAGYKPSQLPQTEKAFEFDEISRKEQVKIENVFSILKKMKCLSKGTRFHHGKEKLICCIFIACGWYNYKKNKTKFN